MTWQTQLKKSMKTATRSAVLWSNNESDVYEYMVLYIKANARRLMKDVDADGPQVMKVKEQMMNDLAQKLSEIMAHMDGFMEELTQREPMDSLSEVDWDEVAEVYEDEVDEAIDFFG